MKFLADNTEENNKEDWITNQLNNNSYKNIVLEQYGTMCLQIIEEFITEYFPNGSTLREWVRLNKKIQPIKGASKIRPFKKCEKSECYCVTKYLDYWITDLESLRSDLWILGFKIDGVKIMTQLLSNLPEEYKNIIENLEYKLDNDINLLAIKIIR